MKNYKDYLFEVVSEDSYFEGDMFFVEEDTFADAARIAKEVYGDEELAFRGIYTPFEAEMLGYDTY